MLRNSLFKNSPMLRVRSVALLLLVTSTSVWADPPPTCALYTGKMDFGDYNRNVHAHGSGTITVSCTTAADLRIHLDGGQSNNIANRKLRHSNGSFAANYNMSYQMYLNTARTQVWGNGITGGAKHVSGTNSTSYIYGRLFAGQTDVLPGEYSDTVGVSLVY